LLEHEHRPRWQPGGGGLCLHTIVPLSKDHERMLIAISTAGNYRTDDGGRTWRPRNDGVRAVFLPNKYPEFGQCVHKVVRDGATPTRLYAQNHRGVYRSDDDGQTWTSIEDGLPTNFGMTAIAHPTRGDSLWLVPIASDGERIPPGAQLQVQRTDDAGATWRTQSAGLPAPSWTNVLRDAAGVDTHDTSPGLYVGTRNGDVFATTDDGESFTRIAEQLPDVLCVRAVTLP
jgi:photosystem II stability/assembly factor-like uncharacterized protein